MNDHEFNITIWRKPTSMRDHEVYITIKCKCGKTIYIKKENYHCQIFYGLFTLFEVVHLDLPSHLCFVHGFRVIEFMS